jgi:hypothetical protein
MKKKSLKKMKIENLKNGEGGEKMKLFPLRSRK